MSATPLSLKGRALRYLAAREHSRAELERKLASHESEPGELARALDELAAKGFISETRVMESVLHRRASKLGAGRVMQELRQKGLGDEALAEAADRLRSTELDRAREVWRKKFGGHRGSKGSSQEDDPGRSEGALGPAERARQMRFLAARGFSGDVVRRVVDGSFDESD